MQCSKPATAVDNFAWMDLESAMTFHLIYHFHIGTHLNHLIFLHTYLLGVFIFLCGFHWGVLIAASALLLLYYALLLRLLAIPYSFVVAIVVIAAYFFTEELRDAIPSRNWWGVCLIGLAIVLASFGCQLLAHAYLESFQAPARLWHGFVAAPALEWAALYYRYKRTSAESDPLIARVWAKVDAVRSEAHVLVDGGTYISPHGY